MSEVAIALCRALRIYADVAAALDIFVVAFVSLIAFVALMVMIAVRRLLKW